MCWLRVNNFLTNIKQWLKLFADHSGKYFW